jgi:hypothetical protein
MDRLLTAAEIAQRLGVRTDWVWAQARAGPGKASTSGAS